MMELEQGRDTVALPLQALYPPASSSPGLDYDREGCVLPKTICSLFRSPSGNFFLRHPVSVPGFHFITLFLLVQLRAPS